jgi:Response regulator receiver domain
MANDILIVDDEADIRDLVAGILEDEGFTTRTARDSDSALAEIANRRPNLVFLDIWLQGSKLDGLQLLEQVKRDQARRIRLHREAFQVRPPHSGSDPGAGNLASETRSKGTQATRAGSGRPDRTLRLHESTAPNHRAGRQGQ